jgi:hypothetical protein
MVCEKVDLYERVYQRRRKRENQNNSFETLSLQLHKIKDIVAYP